MPAIAESVPESVKKFDLVGSIMAYEEGAMDEGEMIEFFQYLIQSNLCWQLQGHYGRTAQAMIQAGYCIA